jgi:PIN domain nuclease of toxin-antitoxin system
MIVLDTHIWIWWLHEPNKLSHLQIDAIKKHEEDIIGISSITCWEIAKLVEYKRIALPLPIADWFDAAFIYPGLQLINLTPEIAIESTRLPGDFHRDPADQIIVATARIHECPVITSDWKILKYPFVNSIR